MSGQGPSGHDPRQQPPVTPPQWGEGPGWRQPQYPPYGQPWHDPRDPQPGYGPPRRRRSRKGLAFLGCGGLAAIVIIFIIVAVAVAPSSPTPSSAAVPEQATAATTATGHAAPAKAAAAQTVTYEVAGSAADVTYGPAGSNSSGTVPMHVTKPLGTPAYYSVTAQLQGSGTVTCKILVGTVVVASSTASGSYNIADCEIVQDPFSGKWEDANQG